MTRYYTFMLLNNVVCKKMYVVSKFVIYRDLKKQNISGHLFCSLYLYINHIHIYINLLCTITFI